MHVNLQDAKAHFPELIEAVRQGETVTIEQSGKPIARLTPPDSPKRKIRFGLMKDEIVIAEDFDEVLEPFGNKAANFFLAASLYHAHKISFSAAAALADLSFDAFLSRLQEHFDSGFRLTDETVIEDMESVANIMSNQ